MEYTILTLITGSRWLCTPLWLLLWRRPPTPFVLLARILVIGWFVVSDFEDGGYARAHDLDSKLGKILDHGADILFTLAVFVPLVRDVPTARDRPRRRRPNRITGPPDAAPQQDDDSTASK